MRTNKKKNIEKSSDNNCATNTSKNDGTQKKDEKNPYENAKWLRMHKNSLTRGQKAASFDFLHSFQFRLPFCIVISYQGLCIEFYVNDAGAF